MEYADGGDLSMKIKAQNGILFPEDKILDWFTQVCLAIKHIHDRKILHRDIKSQNIFLMKDGKVKLGDFGIAKCLDQTIDKAKTYVGTPYYLSPEIINSQPYGFQSDIWSLGVLLYEMCSLKMPFDASNLPQLYMKIINCNYQPLNNKYSDELKNLIRDMLNETSCKRPTISKILENPIIKPRIKKFLNDRQFEDEFNHTILHNFKLGANEVDEKMTKNELSTNNNINNNINISYMNNNIRFSQGHQRPVIRNDRNLRISANNNNNINYHYQQQQKEREQNRINQLKKNLEGKPNNINNNRQNRQGQGANKYNGNNYNYGNNMNNNNIARGFYIINEGKEYKRNDTGRNKKNKNVGKEEYSSDKMGKNIQNKNNLNNNNNDNFYNGLRSENTAKYNLNKKRMEYDKKNNIINSNNIINTGSNVTSSNIAGGNSSYRDKDKERKQKLEEFIKKSRRENKNKISNSNGVIWLPGMQNFPEKNEESVNMNINGVNSKDNNSIQNQNIISENITNEQNKDKDRLNIINNSNKKEINGKNLLPLNNISNYNINNMNNINNMDFSYDSINEEEIDNNNKLYKDVMKGNNIASYNENIFNGIQNNETNQDFMGNITGNDEKNLEIDDETVVGDIYDELNKEFGKELMVNISNIIKKYVNDEMLMYDFNKISENIVNELKNKKISASLIEKAIYKIPDIYFLHLSNKI